MRKEYDLEKLRVKRRGPLPGVEEAVERPAKVRITINLDGDVVANFKAQARKPGALPYQTQINQALRQAMEAEGVSAGAREVKSALLEDPAFLDELAQKVAVRSEG